MKKPDLLTAAQAAAELEVSERRVIALISGGDGPLKAEKFGRAWMIRRESLEAVRDRRPGNPNKGKGSRKV